MITPEQMKQWSEYQKTSGITPAATPSTYSAIDSLIAQKSAPAPASTLSQVSDISDQAKAGVDRMKQGYDDATKATGFVGKLSAGMKQLSGAATVVTSPLAPLFKPVSNIINDVANKVSDIPAVQNFAMSDAGKKTAQVAEFTGDTANVIGTVAGVKGAPKVVSSAVDVAKGTASGVVDSAKGLSKSSDSKIVASYTKAVKPTTAAKTGPGQLDAYNEKVVSGTKAIAENKDVLSFDTEAGPETGRLPTTRGELADAVLQTKQAIFKKYDELAKQSGEQGVTIPLETAGTALDAVISNKSLQLTNPEAITYAKSMQHRLKNEDGTYNSVDPKTAQDAITNWNSSLKAFYRNPSYETASRAAIDAGVVSEIRKALDETISSATGENYQAFKDQYGALSSIEKDVNKAALTQAKQTGSNASGLGKYVDVFSGGDMVSGLLSLNPALFAKGAAQTSISHFFQWFNSPDRAVGNMFKGLENHSNQPRLEPTQSQPIKSTDPTSANIEPTQAQDPHKIKSRGFIAIGGSEEPKFTSSTFKQAVSDNVSKELSSYTHKMPGPGKEVDFEETNRLYELKDITEQRALTAKEVQEAVGLLRKQGIETIPT